MKRLLLALLCLIPMSATANWGDMDGNKLPPGPGQADNGTLAIWLKLVPDERRFREEWANPKEPVQITAIDKVKGGGLVMAALLFTGCQPGQDGACNLTLDLRLFDAGDQQVAEILGGLVWDDQPPPPSVFYVSTNIVGIPIPHEVPDGRYRVEITVHDHNAGTSVTASETYEKITWAKD